MNGEKKNRDRPRRKAGTFSRSHVSSSFWSSFYRHEVNSSQLRKFLADLIENQNQSPEQISLGDCTHFP